MESSKHSRILPFGPFVADLETGELRKDGVKVALQVQPFQPGGPYNAVFVVWGI